MADQNQQEQPIVARSSEEQQQQELQQHSLVDPTTNHVLLHAPYTTTATTTTNTPLCCCFNSNNNPMKRRSPSNSATNTFSCDAANNEHRASKKLFREHQEDLMTLNVNGFSAMSFVPLCHGSGTFQKPCAVIGFPATPLRSPGIATAAAGGSYCLSPDLPRSLEGFVRDPTNNASPASGDNKELILAKEEASNSMKLRRMKDCLREIRKRWDEVLEEGEREEEEEEEDDSEGAEGDGVLSKDDCGGDAEEAVRVEWAEKCLSICFKCPCTKGYQILLSGNNCYYKLV